MLRTLLAVCCPERPRRFRKAFAEQAAEVGRIIKTDQLRDMANIKLCMQKQLAGPVKPQTQQVLIRRNADGLCKQMRKPAYAQVQTGCAVRKRQRLAEMLTEVRRRRTDFAAFGAFLPVDAARQTGKNLQKQSALVKKVCRPAHVVCLRKLVQ